MKGPKRDGPENAVPFPVRKEFWDSMIEKPELVVVHLKVKKVDVEKVSLF